METTTNPIGEKLKARIATELEPLVLSLRHQGKSRDEAILFTFKLIQQRVRSFYRRHDGSIRETMPQLLKELKNAESQIEVILYRLLETSSVDFQFQKPIGPYRADFFVLPDLVVELDGPHHEARKEQDKQRDAYMQRMGFRVLRIPAWALALDEQAVMNEILTWRSQ